MTHELDGVLDRIERRLDLMTDALDNLASPHTLDRAMAKGRLREIIEELKASKEIKP